MSAQNDPLPEFICLWLPVGMEKRMVQPIILYLYYLRGRRTNVLLFCYTGTRAMSPKNKGNCKRKQQKQCYYLIQPEELKRSVPLIQFLQGIAADVMTVEPPPGQAAGVVNAPARLVERAQRILFRTVDMVVDILESGSCLESLDENMIYVDEHFEVPRLLTNNLTEKSDKGRKGNINALGDLLEHVVSESSASYAANKDINPEFKHLIQLTKAYQPGDSLFLIRFHGCMVPLSNRCFLYYIMYGFTMDILRFADQEAYIFVITHMIYPPDWYIRLQPNTYLLRYYTNGFYDPLATVSPDSTDPRLEPLRYNRNCPAHPFEGTADPNAPHCMLLTRSQLGLALYFLCPRLVTSMQTALHYLGELSSLDIQDLFPGRVSNPEHSNPEQ